MNVVGSPEQVIYLNDIGSPVRLFKCWWGQTSLRKSWKTAAYMCGAPFWRVPWTVVEPHLCPSKLTKFLEKASLIVFTQASLLDLPTVAVGTGSS